jgi:ribose/xylose/arabinose/galactoside ABC-type transport system permease subunit
MERGPFDISGQALDHTSNSAAVRYNNSVVSTRSLLASMSGKPNPNFANMPPLVLTKTTSPEPEEQPVRRWGFITRMNRNGHNAWLISTLVFILVVAMSLSFGFVKGWVDAKTTLTASVVFLALLFVAMLIAHWPSRQPPQS